MNDKAVIRYNNGTDEFYTLYKNGILEIRNVNYADNYTEYRCDVRIDEHNRDGDHIMLLYYDNEGKKQCSMAFLAYYRFSHY